MNSLSPYDILTVWEQGHGRVPFEKALLLARLARPDTSVDELADIPIAERELMLLGLRESTLGPRLNAFAACPACSQELEFELGILELREKVSRPVEPREAAIGKFRFRLRRPSTSDLAGIASEGDLPTARIALAARCIVEASRDGLTVDLHQVPKRTLSKLADYLDELEDPAEILIHICCPACGHSWQVPFDIASYFYTELTVLARRLLEEVHVLASAYGWSERDILAMSPARRQFYLERAR
jgi:hypothetical protein